MDPRRTGRSALRPWRCRRRIFSLCLAGRHRGGTAHGHGPQPLHRADRSERGERQSRSPCASGRVARPDRQSHPRDLSRQRMSRLRAALGDHLVAWPRRLHAHRRHPDRGRALRRGERHRPLVVPHHPPTARPRRGRHHGAGSPAGAARRHPGRSHQRSRGHGRRVPRSTIEPSAIRLRRPARGVRGGQAADGSNLAPRAQRHRRGGIA